MRNFYLVALSFIAMSCSNEIDNSVNLDLLATKSIVVEHGIQVVNNGKTLKFENQEIFDEYVYKMRMSSDNDRLALTDSLGFDSLFKIRCQADKELDEIVDASLSKDIFDRLYNKYKIKYSSIFHFNDPESEELFAYSLLEDSYAEYYTGIGGNVIVGDKEIVIKKTSSIELYKRERKEIDITSFMSQIPENDLVVKVGKRKVGLHMSGTWLQKAGDPSRRFYIDANFTAQKKNLFGWVRYSTVYFGTFSLGAFTYQYRLPNGNWGATTIERGDKFTVSTGKEESGNYVWCLGYGEGQGNAKFWSRGVSEADAGYMNVNIPRDNLK